MSREFKESLFYALWLLHDYLPDIVLCGGWVPFIYREYIVKKKPRPPLRTKDIDLATPGKLEVKGNRSIDQILEDAKFEVVQIDTSFHMSHFGKYIPPVTKFRQRIFRTFQDFLVKLKDTIR